MNAMKNAINGIKSDLFSASVSRNDVRAKARTAQAQIIGGNNDAYLKYEHDQLQIVIAKYEGQVAAYRMALIRLGLKGDAIDLIEAGEEPPRFFDQQDGTFLDTVTGATIEPNESYHGGFAVYPKKSCNSIFGGTLGGCKAYLLNKINL